jgi:hypothetical protein
VKTQKIYFIVIMRPQADPVGKDLIPLIQYSLFGLTRASLPAAI